MNKKKFAAKIRPYIMTAPALAGIILFTIYPVIKLVQLSLMNTNMLNPSQSRFIGLDNYRKVLGRPDFQKSLSNTVVYTIAVVLLITVIALLLACLLYTSNPLLQLLTALLLVLMLHFLPFLHDVFNIHLPGDLSFDLLLFRHNQTDLTVIFLG